GADRADEAVARVDKLAIPGLAIVEGHDGAAALGSVLQNGQRVHAHDAAANIAIAVAGPGATLGDVAHDRAGVAADLLRHLLLAGLMRFEAFGKFSHDGALSRPGAFPSRFPVREAPAASSRHCSSSFGPFARIAARRREGVTGTFE